MNQRNFAKNSATLPSLKCLDQTFKIAQSFFPSDPQTQYKPVLVTP